MRDDESADNSPAAATPEKLLEELRAVMDELKVRAHLGRMEAEDAWRKVEPEIRRSIEHIKASVRELVERVDPGEQDAGKES